jgi:hypothetical protein
MSQETWDEWEPYTGLQLIFEKDQLYTDKNFCKIYETFGFHGREDPHCGLLIMIPHIVVDGSHRANQAIHSGK